MYLPYIIAFGSAGSSLIAAFSGADRNTVPYACLCPKVKMIVNSGIGAITPWKNSATDTLCEGRRISRSRPADHHHAEHLAIFGARRVR